MNLPENRRRWLKRKTILNTIHVSAGIFVIAIAFSVAENSIFANLPIEERIISAFASIAITASMFVISGLINPDFMEIVFRMLGFKEENEASQENSNRDEENNERNDFEKLIDEFYVKKKKKFP